MENVLITGVTGFVGANMAKRLEEKYNVVGIVRDMIPNNPLELLGVKNVTLVRGDIECQRIIERVISDYDIDMVFHLAAQSIVKRAHKDPVSTIMTNIVGTVNVLEACRRHGVKVLITSTDKVYGENINAKESDPYKPKEIYGASKACADMIAQTYSKVYNMDVIVTRACNIYGPGDINPRIIPNTIRACLKHESPVIYTNIKGVREYIYIDDVIDAYLFLAERVDRGVFNVGTGIMRGQKEVVEEILSHFKDIKPKYEPGPKIEEIQEQSLDSSKIRLLGWKPKVSFEDGIKRTVEWWKKIWIK